MTKLAFLNVKNSFKHYWSLVISQAFTIMVLFNFQNIVDSDAFAVLGTRNGDYINMLMEMVSFVLGCFMFFFIWYSTNVFLARRKKEIGIYIFMGLSNEKIGKMYLTETILVGLVSLFLGLVAGILSAGLFQMILLAISGLSVDIRFIPGAKPVVVTVVVYLIMDAIFALKGYFNIVGSSVLSMVTVAKQNEYVRQRKLLLIMKAVMGAGILVFGYSLAIKKAESHVMGNASAAVVLVTAGVYLLFGGMIPAGFQTAAGHKFFLYKRQRILWVNSIIFRIKKNYRTYAIVCILMLCSVTALATGFAMKARYHRILHFENTYTFQLVSSRPDLDQEARRMIEADSELLLSAQAPVLYLDASLIEDNANYPYYGILSCSHLKKLAEETGMDAPFDLLEEDQVIKLSYLHLLSMITDTSHVKITINGQRFHQVDVLNTPYLGYLQEQMSFYVVSDEVYRQLLPLGEVQYTYHYQIKDPVHFYQIRTRLDKLVKDTEEEYTARIAIDPFRNELDWVKVLYTICIFMFLVFILASGSILFMKSYQDAFEEKERYQIMLKMGIQREVLRKAAKTEFKAAYGIIFAVMGISSFFSVKALGNMMVSDLLSINLISVGVVFLVMVCFYGLSVRAYEKNTGI